MSRVSIRNTSQIAAITVAVIALWAPIPTMLGAAEKKEASAESDPAAPPTLSLPISCDLGKSCFVQNYVDNDPSADARDYACGAATYDNHKGTDFRLLSATSASQKPVYVLAAASGTIKAVRTNMPDRLVTQFDGPKQRDQKIRGRECGNGVVIDHGNGWETQYCHLLQSSIRLKKGQKVDRGAPIGRVGFSGMAAFAHVHLTVRHKNRVIDPFIGVERGAPCTKTKSLANSIWDNSAQKRLAYHSPVVIDAGFSGNAVKHQHLESNHKTVPLNAKSPALAAFIRLINMRKGDQLTLSVVGPDGFKFSNVTKPLATSKATQTYYGGKKRTLDQWPTGTYTADFKITNNGKPIAHETRTITISK